MVTQSTDVKSLALVALAVAACSSDPAPPPPDLGWMGPLADDALLSQLTIPGTHESGALYEPIQYSAKCQSLTIADQLAAGVRYFDIRCRHVDDAFAIFHGPIDEQQTFDDVLAAMTDFLAANPSETIMISVKQESDPVNTTRSFEATFASYVARDPAVWLLADAVPTLGAARGKLVLVRRFGVSDPAVALPLGLDASQWADNTTFSLTTPGGAMLRVQDAYKVADKTAAAKWAAITALFDEAATDPPATLRLDYTSGYVSHSGVPNNQEVADAINPQLDALFVDPATPNTLGTIAMDHVTASRVQKVIRLSTGTR